MTVSRLSLVCVCFVSVFRLPCLMMVSRLCLGYVQVASITLLASVVFASMGASKCAAAVHLHRRIIDESKLVAPIDALA